MAQLEVFAAHDRAFPVRSGRSRLYSRRTTCFGALRGCRGRTHLSIHPPIGPRKRLPLALRSQRRLHSRRTTCFGALRGSRGRTHLSIHPPIGPCKRLPCALRPQRRLYSRCTTCFGALRGGRGRTHPPICPSQAPSPCTPAAAACIPVAPPFHPSAGIIVSSQPLPAALSKKS